MSLRRAARGVAAPRARRRLFLLLCLGVRLGGGGARSATVSVSDERARAADLLARVMEGVSLQQKGLYDAAAAVYSRVLADDADNADALHLLGLVTYQQADGRAAALLEAAAMVTRAAVLRPGDGGMLANLGEMLRAAGDLAGASATRQMAALLGRYEEPGPCAGVLWNSTPGSATHGGVGAADALRRAGILAPDSELVWRNAAAVAQQAGDWQTLEESDRQLLRVLGLDADAAARPAGLPVEDLEVRTRVELADAVQRQGDRPEEAWALFDAALRVAPEDARALIGAGVAAQHLGLLDQAAELYTSAIAAAETAPPDDAAANEAIGRQARVNLAAVFHERGDMLSAIFMYKAVLETAPGDTQALNNLGAALVTVGRHDEAVEVLERCLAADSDQPQALTNLALHYGNEGEMARAAEYSAAARALLARRPDERSRNARAGLLLREVTSMSPVVTSTVDVCTVRAALAVRVATLLHALRGNSTYRAQRRVHEPVSDVEQVHFYLPYAGLNDRPLQEAIVQVFELVAPTVGVIAPHAAQASLECLGGPAAALGKRLGKRKTRVGFTSKFFGEHEPHGLLLEGVVEHLPRDRFEVYVLPIASPGRAAASELLTRAADLVVPLSLNFAQARAALVSAQLDVLVFADLLSEPMSYFLGFSRFAPIQLAFWGNPISSGRGSIDYFVSADRMEHPFRTTLPASEEPYTEQVLTLDGQGIWYRKPVLAPSALFPPMGDAARPAVVSAARRALGLPERATLLLCAQSNFKLHPKYDQVVLRILQITSNDTLVVFTEGRRARWTKLLRERLETALGPVLNNRVVFLPRQPPGDAYMQMLACSDVIIHPFPFDGSRTSADGIALAIPVVTRPTVHLRARMAASFYATMGLDDGAKSCLVADSTDDYVEFAARLAGNAAFRASVSARIRETSHLIWEDRHYVYEWARLLSRLVGAPAVAPGDVGCDAACLARGQRTTNSFAGTEHQFAARRKPADGPIASGAVGARETGAEGARASGAEGVAAPSPRVECAGTDALALGWAREARKVYDFGDVAESIQLLQNVAAACFDDGAATGCCRGLAESRVRSDLGAALQQRGDLVAAARELRRSLELDGTNAVALNNLAVTLHGSAEAVELYAAALEASRDPSQRANALFNAANADRDGGDVAGAAKRLVSGLGASGSDQLLNALMQPANHHAPDAAAAQLRLEALVPATSLAVLLSHLAPLSNFFPSDDGAPSGAGDTLSARFGALAAKHAARKPWGLDPVERRGPDGTYGDGDVSGGAFESGVERAPTADEVSPLGGAHERRGVHVVTQPFSASTVLRTAEMKFVLMMNLLCAHVDAVHVLAETDADARVYEALADGHAGARAKLRVQVLHRRLRFRDAFEYAATHLSGEVVAVANADVFFDETLARIGDARSLDLTNRVFALVRWDWACARFETSDVSIVSAAVNETRRRSAGDCNRLEPRTDSQDAWIFRSPLPAAALESQIELGRARCDNRLAAFLEKAVGMDLASPSLSIRSNHIQGVLAGPVAQNLRAYASDADEVKGASKYVLLSDQWLF